jgi:4'-phosphopantetheinyl transferase EntD
LKLNFVRDTLDLPEGIEQIALERPSTDPSWLSSVPFPIPSGCDERRCDFALSRLCIHEAVGQTEWPVDCRGSITHSKGQWAWAAFGPKSRVRAMGIDTESLSRVWKNPKTEDGIQKKILADEEVLRLRESGLDWRVVFSAKESLFKCFSSGFGISPAFKMFEWVDHSERVLRFRFEETTYDVRYRVHGPWTHTAAVVLT